MHLAKVAIGLLTAGAIAIGATAVRAQPAASAPPAVGIVEAAKRPITETSEFLGRIQAVNQVNVVARVTAFLEKRLFERAPRSRRGMNSTVSNAVRSKPISQRRRRLWRNSRRHSTTPN